MKILAFAASNSQQSINQSLVRYAGRILAETVADLSLEVLDLNDFKLPLFSVDLEKSVGTPDAAQSFFARIGQADALLVSFAEHNGSYCAAYKNLFDWMSRIDSKVFQGKRAVFLATSPGAGGAKSVLTAAETSAPYFGADLRASFSLPRFQAAFDLAEGRISDPNFDQQLRAAVATLLA